MHEKQVKILKKLEKENGLKFSSLGRGFDFDDKFPYHLKQLIKNKYVYKENDLYYISKEGLQNSLYFDTTTFGPVKFKNVAVAFICRVGDSFILHEKTSGGVQYYYFPRGKMLFGESATDACKRVFLKKIGITDDVLFHYHSTHIKRQRTSKGELLFDSVSLFFSVDLPEEKIGKISLAPLTKALSIEEIKELQYRWPEIDLILFSSAHQHFYEYDFVCDEIKTDLH